MPGTAACLTAFPCLVRPATGRSHRVKVRPWAGLPNVARDADANRRPRPAPPRHGAGRAVGTGVTRPCDAAGRPRPCRPDVPSEGVPIGEGLLPTIEVAGGGQGPRLVPLPRRLDAAPSDGETRPRVGTGGRPAEDSPVTPVPVGRLLATAERPVGTAVATGADARRPPARLPFLVPATPALVGPGRPPGVVEATVGEPNTPDGVDRPDTVVPLVVAEPGRPDRKGAVGAKEAAALSPREDTPVDAVGRRLDGLLALVVGGTG